VIQDLCFSRMEAGISGLRYTLPRDVQLKVASYLIHMHINRLIRNQQRSHELIMYDMLDRIFTSMDKRVTGKERSEH